MHIRLLFATLPFLIAAGTGIAMAQTPAAAIAVQAGQERWNPAPPNLPPGAELAVLEGDPRKPGLFTLRIRLPAGAQLAPHTHPAAERVTVISGSVGLGFGVAFDQTALRLFRAGDYYVNPPGIPHYVAFPEPTVIQVTAEGPWGLDFVIQP